MGIGSAINYVFTPWNLATVSMRHTVDIDGTFGRQSKRTNMRNEYRTGYNAKDRYAAGIGTAMGVALPAYGIAREAMKGFSHPMWSGGSVLGMPVGRSARIGIGIGAAGLMAGVGGVRMYDMTKDDGHLGAVASLGGLVAGGMAGAKVGTMVGQKIGGVKGALIGAVVGGAFTVGGGVAAYQGGERVNKNTPGFGWIGDRQIGKPVAHTAKTATTFPGTARDYSRGLWNSWSEGGPFSQGIGFAYSWKMQDASVNHFSQAEHGGALAGDLLAVSVLGGGALATGARIIRGKSSGTLATLESTTMGQKTGQWITGKMLSMGASGGTALALTGAGLTAAAIGNEAINNPLGGKIADKIGVDKKIGQAIVGVGTAALGAGIYAGLAKSSFMAGAKARPAINIATAAVLLSALSAARMPAQQFFVDAQTVRDKKFTSSDRGSRGLAMAVGAAAGGFAGQSLGRSILGGTGTLGKVGVGAATLVGAGLGTFAMWGVAPTLPGLKDTAIGLGGGAAALGGATLLLKQGSRGTKAGSALPLAAVGALAGLSAAAIFAKGKAPETPATPTEAVTGG